MVVMSWPKNFDSTSWCVVNIALKMYGGWQNHAEEMPAAAESVPAAAERNMVVLLLFRLHILQF